MEKSVVSRYSSNGSIGSINTIDDLKLYASQSRFPEADLRWLDPELFSPLRSANHETETVEGIDNQRFYIDETNLTERRFLPMLEIEETPLPAPAPASGSVSVSVKSSSISKPKKESLPAPMDVASPPPIELFPSIPKKISKKIKTSTTLLECFIKIWNERKESSMIDKTSPMTFLNTIEYDEMTFTSALNEIAVSLKEIKPSIEQRNYIRELNVKLSEIG
jgi:hypothetical protein